jgi:molybdate transport system ATP-binding protein
MMLDVDVRIDHQDFAADVSATFPGDGVTALFGPSGSGKTTLLRAIAGFGPCRGTIRYDNATWQDDRTSLAAHKRPIGYVFQETRLFPHLDVHGNLAYAMKRAHKPDAIELDDVVEQLDLTKLLYRSTNDLSGGEAKRVALARTLLTAPELLLLDEPLAGLDQARKREILPYLERIAKAYRIPTIFVSHVIEEVARLADAVVVLHEGSVRFSGPIAAFLESADTQPLTPIAETGVAIPAVVASVDTNAKSLTLEADGHEIVTPATHELVEGDTLRLFIRARDVAIATARPSQISIRNVLPVKVDAIDVVEDSPYAEIYLSLNDHILHARITRLSLAELGLEVGQEVFALVKSVSFDV